MLKAPLFEISPLIESFYLEQTGYRKISTKEWRSINKSYRALKSIEDPMRWVFISYEDKEYPVLLKKSEDHEIILLGPKSIRLMKAKIEKDLEYWKKKLLEILESSETQKSLEEILFPGILIKSLPDGIQDMLIKAKRFDPGTIRTWGGKEFKKMASGKWVRTYSETESRGAKQAVRNVHKKILSAKSMEELLDIAKENHERFRGKDGELLPIVKEFVTAARGTKAGEKQKVEIPKKEAQPEEPKTEENKEEIESTESTYQTEESDKVQETSEETDIEVIPEREPEKDPENINKAIESATPENRSDVQAELFGSSGKDGSEKYDYKPGKREINGKMVDDYTTAIPKNMNLPNEKNILKEDRPSWIPDIPIDRMERSRFMPTFMNMPNDELMIIVDGKATIVSMEVYAGMVSYYSTYSKEKYKEDKQAYIDKTYNEEKDNVDNPEASEYRRNFAKRVVQAYESNDKKFLNKIYHKKQARILSANNMTYSQSAAYSQMGKKTSTEKWKAYSDFREELAYKMADMKFQYDENMNAHSKGRETSYGEKGTKDTLVETYGVKIKRQNGSEITPEETNEIKTALDNMYKVFGDRSSMSKKFGLKISHAGEKHQHASKFIGLYAPSYKAIGVGFTSQERGGLTLSHEYSHFMDNYLGGDDYHYASDKKGTAANEIARTFRKSMVEGSKSDGYWGRTCECFARALEQYYDHETETNLVSGTRQYVEPDKFDSDIRPLIDKFFKENDELLKSIEIIW